MLYTSLDSNNFVIAGKPVYPDWSAEPTDLFDDTQVVPVSNHSLDTSSLTYAPVRSKLVYYAGPTEGLPGPYQHLTLESRGNLTVTTPADDSFAPVLGRLCYEIITFINDYQRDDVSPKFTIQPKSSWDPVVLFKPQVAKTGSSTYAKLVCDKVETSLTKLERSLTPYMRVKMLVTFVLAPGYTYKFMYGQRFIPYHQPSRTAAGVFNGFLISTSIVVANLLVLNSDLAKLPPPDEEVVTNDRLNKLTFS